MTSEIGLPYMEIFNGKSRLTRLWAEEGKDQFVLEHKKSLLLNLIYDWPRRHQTLLEVSCGAGEHLGFFWETGFDITGVDSHPTKIYAARARLGRKAELYIGQADHLSFEDRQFDYVALINTLEIWTSPEAVLYEAARVCKKGLLIGFLNRFFWYSMIGDMSSKWISPLHLEGKSKGRSWPEIKKMLQRNISRSFALSAGSTLPCPQWTWLQYCLSSKMNKKIYSPNIGMFSAVRVDLFNEKSITPLLAWKTEPKAI